MRNLILTLSLALALATARLDAHCIAEAYGVYAEAYSVQGTNQSLAKGLSVEAMYERGILADDPVPVYAMKNGVPDPTQPTGFKRVRLPRALTGMFVPDGVDLRDPKSIEGYDGYLIIVPGIGTNRSDATTLFTIGQTLNSGREPALKVEGREKKLRLLPILLDATLGGMAEKSPLFFGDHWEAMEVIRQARLIMKNAFPKSPCLIGGRSQGGLMAMEYGEWFGDVQGIVAVNPSPTRPDLHKRAMELGVASLNTMMDSPLKLNRTFGSYDIHTSNYVGFGAHGRVHGLHRWLIRSMRPTRVDPPLLILVGTKDEGYPPEYVDYAKAFAAEKPHREIELFEGGHDLWSRRDKPLFRAVIGRMAVFSDKVLAP